MRRFVLALVPLAYSGCLPGDTRPVPAEVTVTTSSSSFTLSGLPADLTADGFEIDFERLLVSLGQADVGNVEGTGTCNEYSNPDYTRLYDFTQVNAPREVGLAFATGHCAFGFSMRFPNPTTPLDVGVTADDATFMRTAGSDPVSMDGGISVYVEGVGMRGDVVKHFAWPFRKRVGYSDCYVMDEASGSTQRGLDLTSGEKTSVNLEVHAEALFLDPLFMAHFEPFARADANGDGEITLDELWTVPLESIADSGFKAPPNPPPPDPLDPTRKPGCFNADGIPIEIKTLGDYTYCELLPALVHFQGNGLCTTQVGRANND
jgi:hypothetical protein